MVQIIDKIDRLYSVWKGGSILCDLLTRQNSWITLEEYEENGA